ncbi:hypothetical protein BASA62_009438 [Batrachochytrium salamandrivorans]|nr:hypothetical protein BASA62_009438 [Batrachochytrium salamandrivorans]
MGLIRIVITIALLLTLAVRGIQKQSLSYSGAVAAVLLGGVILSHPSMLFGSLLLTFYLSSSKLTKFKSEVKKQLEEGHLEGGQRNAVQVLSNGLTGFGSLLSALVLEQYSSRRCQCTSRMVCVDTSDAFCVYWPLCKLQWRHMGE